MKKTAVILGGSSGIGRAIAYRFLKERWRILVASSNVEKIKIIAKELEGLDYIALKVDVSSTEDLNQLKKTVAEEFGQIDVFINSVGLSKSVDIVNSKFEDWDQSLQVMMYGAVKATRLLIPFIKDGGRIINITSIHWQRVATGSSAYGMAKAALTQFTRSLAVELAHREILVNAIAPGFINTPMSVKENGKNEMDSEWFFDNYVKYGHLPLKRAGKPEEISGIAWFLADATYITGSVITADGGLTITF